jgi:heat shock protein HslJ
MAAALVGVTLGVATPAHAGDVPGPSNNASAQGVDIVGTWFSARVKVPQKVQFGADGSVSGNAGCNSFAGGYTLKGNTIKIGPLASTLMACPDAEMYAEAQFLAKLQGAQKVSQDCGTLVLTGSAGRLVLKSTRPGSPVVACSIARP